MTDKSFYPQIMPEEDAIKMLNAKLKAYRVKAIKDFVNELNEDYNKYNNKKISIVYLKIL